MDDYKIKELYEQMELEIIASMKRNLSRHLKEENKVGFTFTQWQAIKLKELLKYQKENKIIRNKYLKNFNKKIGEHLLKEFKQGYGKEIKLYNYLNENKLNSSFFKINDKKVKQLIKVVNNDLNEANKAVLRMVNDEYRQIIHKSAFFVANGVKTEEQATKEAVKEINQKKMTIEAIDKASESFLRGGINCVEYKNGRRVNIASYAQMAVRTASQRAQLMGEGEFRKQINNPLVIVSKHNTTCKLCEPWQGKVLIDDVYSGGTKEDGNYPLLSEAMEKGLFHPNCRHGLPSFYPELEDFNHYIDEHNHEENEINLEEQYINRQIKSFERLEKGSLLPLNIQLFAERKEEWINKKVKKYGKEEVDISYKNVKHQTPDRRQYEKYKNILKNSEYMPKTFEDFVNFKYNITNQWEKLKDDYQWAKHRLKAINNGELTPLSDINHYLKIKDEAHKKLIGIKLANNLEVKTISYHFIDRVIGCIEQRRSGVKIDDIADSLNGNYDIKEIDKSIKIYGLDNIVTINKETGNLIQVNPHTRRKK